MGYGLAMGEVQEPWLYHELQRQFQATPIAAFIDIGTNIGQTLIKVKTLDPGVPYMGFDPNPTCMYYLQQLVSLNKLTDTSLHCVGLGDHQQLATFHFAGTDDVCGTLSEDHVTATTNHAMTIPVWPLDEVPFSVSRAGKIIVKIDVEGYEYAVIRGAANFIAQYRPVLLIEILPHQQKASAKQHAIDMFNMLKGWNYSAYQIKRTGERVEINALPDNATDIIDIDYLFMPGQSNA